MKNWTLMKLAAPLLTLIGLGMDAAAQCPIPDRLDGGPCCTTAQPLVPPPRPFTQEAMQICWRDCDIESTDICRAQWTLGNNNQSPCAVRNMRLTLRGPGGVVKWRGNFRVQYSRTWMETSPVGAPIQVYRYLANGDLRNLPAAGGVPCPVPPSAPVFGNRAKFTGYIDMARSCQVFPNGQTTQFSWMLTRACDRIDHAPGFPRAGVFHPDRSYTFVGPAAGFVPTPALPIEMGASPAEGVRRVDLSAGTPMCEYEEPVDFSLQPIQQFCLCGPAAAQPQWALSNLTLGGVCGTSITTPGGPFLPGFLSMSIGFWTDPLTYPGEEMLRWNAGGYDYTDPCTGITRPEVFYGVTTMQGYDAFTIPSTAGSVPTPLPLTFIDQSNALRAGNTIMNVPWKRSDHFLNLNLP